MKIVEIKDRNSVLIERLVNVWEDSLRMTHLFLSDLEIENIKNTSRKLYMMFQI